MDLMLLRITTFFHAQLSSVYSILLNQTFYLNKLISKFIWQEENDQAFSISL